MFCLLIELMAYVSTRCYCVVARKCKNCSNEAADDSEYCHVCTAKLRPCDECSALLLPYRFARGMSTCKKCTRRLAGPVQKRAMSAAETEIPTSDTDVDLGVFLDNNQARIAEILQQALNEHQ